MKICPYCKAQLPEEARFCVYCMSSLEEKQVLRFNKAKKRRTVLLIALTAVCLICAVSAVWLALFSNGTNDPADTVNSDSTLYPPGDGKESGTSPETEYSDTEDAPDNTKEPPESKDSAADSIKEPSDTEEDIPSSDEIASDTQPKQTEETSEPIPDGNIYIYEEVKAGDRYNLFYAFPNRSAVIVGVETPSADGEYIIPDTIDGRTVVGIMEGAFCGDAIKDTVKKVTLPASVKTVDSGAFGECNNLSDIYFMGDYIYVMTDAFAPEHIRNGALTIHCSYNCTDGYMRYYRDTHISYDAEYEEWQP